jgi:hypothetical protein
MKKTEKTETKNKNLVVEIPLPDGWMSMFIGRLVRKTKDEIVLTDASWISDTGRRHLFFKGEFDSRCEIEPYPDGYEIELPAKGAIKTAWMHPLPRNPK